MFAVSDISPAFFDTLAQISIKKPVILYLSEPDSDKIIVNSAGVGFNLILKNTVNQFSAFLADTFEEFVGISCTTSLLKKPPCSSKSIVITNSRSIASSVTASAENLGMQLPKFPKNALKNISSVNVVDNPMIVSWELLNQDGLFDLLSESFSKLDAENAIFIILGSNRQELAVAFSSIQARLRKQFWFCTENAEFARKLRDAHFPVFTSHEHLLKVLGKEIDFGERLILLRRKGIIKKAVFQVHEDIPLDRKLKRASKNEFVDILKSSDLKQFYKPKPENKIIDFLDVRLWESATFPRAVSVATVCKFKRYITSSITRLLPMGNLDTIDMINRLEGKDSYPISQIKMKKRLQENFFLILANLSTLYTSRTDIGSIRCCLEVSGNSVNISFIEFLL
jgi:hypothetical protein